MDEKFLRRLGYMDDDLKRAGAAAGKVRDVSTLLGDIASALKDTKLLEAMGKVFPDWAAPLAMSAAEATPFLKIVMGFFKELTQINDPLALGRLACVAAFEKATEEALRAVGDRLKVDPAARGSADEVTAALKKLDATDHDFGTFRPDRAADHGFTKDSLAALAAVLKAAGVSEAVSREILGIVQRRFVINLKLLLSHRDTSEKFAPFVALLSLGNEESDAYAFLDAHQRSQLAEFGARPLFGREPFSLEHIYVDTDCGVLRGRELRAPARGEANRIDPFEESAGGRYELLGTVVQLLRDERFRDAVLIQGVAGSGKSAFTLRLCKNLVDEGLRPIRIRLRDVTFDDRHATEALARAVYVDRADGEADDHPDPFLDLRIFDEAVEFGGARICPYVLILDGWDEISISVNEGFRVRVQRMLEQIRTELLHPRRSPPVRIVLTGRPSVDVTEGFIRDDTAILTVRPLRFHQLRDLVTRIRSQLIARPLAFDGAETWRIDDLVPFKAVFDAYSAAEENQEWSSRSLEVLGLPFLAYLAVRLIARSDPKTAAALVDSPTTLYRHLVDLTVERGGGDPSVRLEVEGIHRIVGDDLRWFLHDIASAMTALGQESISHEELELRLQLEPGQLDVRTERVTQETLAKVLIAFFFKGGLRHLGCEFVHKSIREYLFAEAVVEVLKRYGRDARADLPPHAVYWADFTPGRGDARFDLSRTLGRMLAPHWLSFEVIDYIETLLGWEVRRAFSKVEDPGPGRPTAGLRPEEWSRVRDGLADLWYWWSEGCHLRPQPELRGTRRQLGFLPPFAQALAEWSTPQAVDRGELPPAPRTTTMDAHLGDALFRLTALVHFLVADAEGWTRAGRTPSERWEGARPGLRPCQIVVEDGSVLFRPAGDYPRLFPAMAARINAAGWRSQPFPQSVDARGISMRETILFFPGRSWDQHHITRWDFADLRDAVFADTSLIRHSFEDAWLKGANFAGTALFLVSFERADLEGAVFHHAFFLDVDGFTEESIEFGAQVAGAFIPTELRNVLRRLGHESIELGEVFVHRAGIFIRGHLTMLKPLDLHKEG